jgi:hypothetical protein
MAFGEREGRLTDFVRRNLMLFYQLVIVKAFCMPRPLIRPSATFSRWKKREKAEAFALSRISSRERVAKGRVRGHLHKLTPP